MKGLKGVAY